MNKYNKWIMVKEQLPPIYNLVFVRTRYGNYVVSSMNHYLDEITWSKFNDYNDPIICWMPIPEL